APRAGAALAPERRVDVQRGADALLGDRDRELDRVQLRRTDELVARLLDGGHRSLERRTQACRLDLGFGAPLGAAELEAALARLLLDGCRARLCLRDDLRRAVGRADARADDPAAGLELPQDERPPHPPA